MFRLFVAGLFSLSCAAHSGQSGAKRPGGEVSTSAATIKKEWCLQQATNQSGQPVLILGNLAYRHFKGRGGSPFLVHINITMAKSQTNGLPTKSESKVLNELEDDLLPELMSDKTTHFVGTATSGGFRELIFYVPDAENTQAELKRMVQTPNQPRVWEYRISLDREWNQANTLLGESSECL